MQITVEYAAQIKRAAGTPRDDIELESPATLADVVAAIAVKRGDALRGTLLSAQSTVHPSILIFVGDNQVRDAMDHPVQDGDVVTFLSPISGG